MQRRTSLAIGVALLLVGASTFTLLAILEMLPAGLAAAVEFLASGPVVGPFGMIVVGF